MRKRGTTRGKAPVLDKSPRGQKRKLADDDCSFPPLKKLIHEIPQSEQSGGCYAKIELVLGLIHSKQLRKPNYEKRTNGWLQEKMKVCSGRDELCHSVLNDEWASHPTWASEDSGFVAHRKNQWEEALHRIEEERHDYDFNIEALSRTIQLLHPYAQQLRNMLEQERKNMRLPEGLGGQSTTIHKRVIKKIYGRDKGEVVCHGLLADPGDVVPLLLNRLQVKFEEWKASQVITLHHSLISVPL